MALCPKDLSKFKTTTTFNEFMPISDHQIIVTTCMNAAQERTRLLEFMRYAKVTGLPNHYDCAEPE